MKILISNDDGVLAPGLASLYAAMADLGDVTVVAPDSPQSAAGHSITIRGPLSVRKVHVEGPRDFHAVSVDGRPADCVRLAIFELLDGPPDLVLSGINAGANVGIHVFYSGTVAAAAEGAMFRIPAVAFSAEVADGEVDFPRAATYCRGVLEAILADGLGPGDLVNVNVPSFSRGAPKGVKVTHQSTVELRDVYRKMHTEGDRDIYEIVDFSFDTGDPDSDVASLAAGFVTVTPLHVDMTHHPSLGRLSGVRWPEQQEG